MRGCGVLAVLAITCVVGSGLQEDGAWDVDRNDQVHGRGGSGVAHLQGVDERDRSEAALRHLVAGNNLQMEGRNSEAIAEWKAAASLRPDSNVPWNNIANAHVAAGDKESAARAAQTAFEILNDYMSATTLGEILKSMKMYEEAESVLLRGCSATVARDEHFEHPFWALANLYLNQGDLLEFVRWAAVGLDRLSRPLCEAGRSGSPQPCPEMASHEKDVSGNLFESSIHLAKNFASHGRFEEALAHFEVAIRVQESFPQMTLAPDDPRDDPALHAECVRCRMGSREAGIGCEQALGVRQCEERWKNTDEKYLRMMPVRLMGCDWRNREQDRADFLRMANLESLLNHTLEFFFECDGGLVCGVGGQPPMHLWGLDLPLETVKVMGSVHPAQVRRKMAEFGPTPEWAYPAWDPSVGQRFKIGYLSGDLLLDHPVGNMMRYVLPLHDLSRMDVTLFMVHEHQRAKAQDVANKHLLGDVKIVFLGRGPHVTRQWDERESVDAADIINSAGICLLYDLSGYTMGHRQDVLALNPAPVQAHYHGYMGTTAAPWIHSYVADRTIAPPEHSPFFTEKLAFLPESFLGPSHRLTHQLWGAASGSDTEEHSEGGYELAERRRDEGLPSEGLVICYFNQHFKIDPGTFGVWTRAMRRLNSSEDHPPVLWMLRGNAVSHRNLWREFEAAGLSREHLVFARRVMPKAHIRRASMCDIAVDSPMYNSGATGADTLYAGVPIVSLPGNKCVGRMVAGFLGALRIQELVVRNERDYEDMLIKLLHDRDRAGPRRGLQALRRRLHRGVVRAPFFDVANWVADYDQMSRMMWDAFVSAERHFHIVPVRSD